MNLADDIPHIAKRLTTNRPRVCKSAGLALRATKGDENPWGSGDFDEARKGWPGGQPRTRGSALLWQVFDHAPQKTVGQRIWKRYSIRVASAAYCTRPSGPMATRSR